MKMIKVYKGDYDKTEFYALMGKFFAERNFQKEIPYLCNYDNLIWYLKIVNQEVVAFGNYEENTNITFKNDYYLYDISDLHDIIKAKINAIGNKTIYTAHSNPKIIELFKKFGFNEYKCSTNYIFMRRDHNDR